MRFCEEQAVDVVFLNLEISKQIALAAAIREVKPAISIVFVIADELYKLKGSLSYWKERLPPEKFFRCHNGYIVNLRKIEYIAPFFKNAYSIKLLGSIETIPVSRTFAKSLKQRILLMA